MRNAALFLLDNGVSPKDKLSTQSILIINVESIRVYICADTLGGSGQVVVLREGFGGIHPFQRLPNTYFGVRHPDSLILYHAMDSTSYLLYWIGENEIDEGGEGDDIKY